VGHARTHAVLGLDTNAYMGFGITQHRTHAQLNQLTLAPEATATASA